MLGTEDMEAGMRPSPARHFVAIMLIAVAMLAVFNSRAAVEWAQRPQAGPIVAALEQPAVAWHGWMAQLGAAVFFEAARRTVQATLSEGFPVAAVPMMRAPG
jgi:hypothetical protein